MAQAADGRTPEQVRHDIEQEREQLASAVEGLRAGLGEVTDVTGKLRGKLPAVAVGGGALLAKMIDWRGHAHPRD